MTTYLSLSKTGTDRDKPVRLRIQTDDDGYVCSVGVLKEAHVVNADALGHILGNQMVGKKEDEALRWLRKTAVLFSNVPILERV